MRCLEQAKECARKIKDKFSESECFHCIGKVWPRSWGRASEDIPSVIIFWNSSMTFIHRCSFLWVILWRLDDLWRKLSSWVPSSLWTGRLWRKISNMVIYFLLSAQSCWLFVFSQKYFFFSTRQQSWCFVSIATADRGCKLEEELGEDQGKGPSSHQAVGLAEQLGDLYSKVGCYSKALDAYQAQVKQVYF